ncbi:MAG: dihydrofolate reductase family protein [Anaerolineae bacterium]|nr:dihydrofolate reductase family protein [Anaerolineae bacterium]
MMTKPHVIVCQEVSVDGRLAMSPGALLLYGDERWEAIRQWSREETDSFNVFEYLRSHYAPQATLEGSGSFVRDQDDPSPLPAYKGDPEPLYQDFLPPAILNRPGHRGWFTAVDGRGRIRWLYKEYPDEAWTGWYPLVWIGYHTPIDYLAYLRDEDIPYLVAGNEHVDLGLALEKMNAHLGVTCILSTGGGRLNGALLRAGLVDELSIEFLPALIGGTETPSLFDSPALKPGEWPARLELISTQADLSPGHGGRVWLRYRVCPPSAS